MNINTCIIIQILVNIIFRSKSSTGIGTSAENRFRVSVPKIVEESRSFCSTYFNASVFSENLPCKSVEIYYEEELFKLCPCSIIDGYLQINFQVKNKELISNASFPLLREVSEYISLQGLHGLLSVAKLFPNLAIIRGEKLVGKYSILLDKNRNLVESSLPSIRFVGRGSVVVDKKDFSDFDSTCVMKNLNKSSSINTSENTEQCTWTVPLSNKTKTCKNICPHNCSPYGECCSPECFGGCDVPLDPATCTACKGVKYAGICRKDCPFPLYKMGHFCVKRKDCVSRKHLLKEDTRDCLRQEFCPEGYKMHEGAERICQLCQNVSLCPRVCHSSTVRNINEAMNLRGCNIIEGSLTIYDVVEELPEEILSDALSSLRDVYDYVWVVGSHWTSLNFLRNVKVIRGHNLYKNYSLVVESMKNLKNIFTNVAKNNNNKLRIENGDIIFISNPLLCPNKIHKFVNGCENVTLDKCGLGKCGEKTARGYTCESGGLELEKASQKIIATANGFQASCGVIHLEAKVEQLSVTGSLKVLWMFNSRYNSLKLASVTIFYKKVSENEIVTEKSILNSCNEDWTVLVGSPKQMNYVEISNLESDSRYAFRIQGLTLGDTRSGVKAQSDIIFGRSVASNPSSPRNIKTESKTPNSLFIKWDSPLRPNGVIDHYILTLKLVNRKTNIPYRYFDACKLYDEKKMPSYQQWQNQQHQNFNNQNPKTHNQQQQHYTNLSNATKNFILEERNTSHEPSLLWQPSCFCKKHKSENEKKNKFSANVMENYNNFPLYWRENYQHLYNGFEEIPKEPVYEIYKNYSTESYTISLQVNIRIKTKDTFYEVSSLQPFGLYEIEVTACHKQRECGTHYFRKFGGKIRSREIEMCILCSIKSGVGTGIVNVDQSKSRSPNIILSIVNGTSELKHRPHLQWFSTSTMTENVLAFILEFRKMDNEVSSWRNICVSHDGRERERILMIDSLVPNFDSGKYATRLRVTTLAFTSCPTEWVEFVYEAPYENQTLLIVKILGLVAVGEILVAILAYIVWSRFRRSQFALRRWEYHKSFDGNFPNMSQNFEKDFILKPDNIGLLEDHKTLGNGYFGHVYESLLDKGGELQKVAVKVLNSARGVRDFERFVQEARVMQRLDCEHVIRLLGVVCSGPTFMSVMELMENKDLQTYIKSQGKRTLSKQLLLKMATQAADGMAYLNSRHLVHRDLAARNCLLNTALTLKIADLGFAEPPCSCEKIYLSTKMPIRWMAPESLKANIFTSKSDVWSYGVLLWEMCTSCDIPYKGLCSETVSVMVVRDKETLSIPPSSTSPFIKVMKRCWQYDPESRPSFRTIVKYLLQQLSTTDRESFKTVSHYHNSHSNQIDNGTPEEGIPGIWESETDTDSDVGGDQDHHLEQDVERGLLSSTREYCDIHISPEDEEEEDSGRVESLPSASLYDFHKLRKYKKRKYRYTESKAIGKEVGSSKYKFLEPAALENDIPTMYSFDQLQDQSPTQDPSSSTDKLSFRNTYSGNTSNFKGNKIKSEELNRITYLSQNRISIPPIFMCQCPDSHSQENLQPQQPQQPQQSQQQPQNQKHFSPINIFHKNKNTIVNKNCVPNCTCNSKALTVSNNFYANSEV